MTWPVIAGAAAWGVVTAVGGAVLTTIGPWYYALRKPPWQPPDFLFGPVWTAIFAASATAAALAWPHTPDAGTRLRIVLLYVANGALNIVWSLLFFRLRRPDWAMIEVAALWLSCLGMIVAVFPLSRLGGWLVVPYLLWVSFASVLNYEIIRRNRPFGRAPS